MHSDNIKKIPIVKMTFFLTFPLTNKVKFLNSYGIKYSNITLPITVNENKVLYVLIHSG